MNEPLAVQANDQQIYHDIIECLITALEARDPYSQAHSARVADMSVDLAQALHLSPPAIAEIHLAGHVHDIGKIGIPDQILHKPTRLTSEEWLIIKRHPDIGMAILSRAPSLRPIARLVLHHHERWDGQGYPLGLRGEDIPLGARILALCDSVDAMTSARPYRAAMRWEQCWDEIYAGSGRQFDPALENALKPYGQAG